MFVRKLGLNTIVLVAILLSMMLALFSMYQKGMLSLVIMVILNFCAAGLIFSNVNERRHVIRKQSCKMVIRGEDYLKRGQLHSAKASFEEALFFDSSNAGALMGLGHYHRDRKDFSAAADFYNRAVRIDPRSYLAHFLAGSCLQKTGDYINAQDELERSIELAPSFLEPYLPLTDIYLKKGDSKRAEECIKKFLEKPLKENIRVSILEKLETIINQRSEVKGNRMCC